MQTSPDSRVLRPVRGIQDTEVHPKGDNIFGM